MPNINFVIRAAHKIDISSLKSTIKLVHNRSGKSCLFIFFDMLRCAVLYGAGYNDYRFCRFETLNKNQRKTYVTRGINNKAVALLNDKHYINLINNKVEFNKRFNIFLNRRWIDLGNSSKEEFKKFIIGLPCIIGKVTHGSCGKGVEKYSIADYKSSDELYDLLVFKKQYLVEECLVQHTTMSKLYPCSVNTVRIVTINRNNRQNVLYAYLRIGNNKNIVDNMNSGGMCAPIELASGTIKYPAYDKNEQSYNIHPYTDEPIIGFKIPNWDQAVKLCLDASRLIVQVGYIGWDVCITENSVCFVEANDYPGHDILQLPCHIGKDKNGMLPLFKKYIPKL